MRSAELDVPAAAGAASDGEVVAVDFVMVEVAEQDAVVDRRVPLIAVPPVDVMDLAPPGGLGAAGELAPAVASNDRSTLLAGVQPHRAAQVDGYVVGVDHDAGELGVAPDPGHLRERARGAVLERHRVHRNQHR